MRKEREKVECAWLSPRCLCSGFVSPRHSRVGGGGGGLGFNLAGPTSLVHMRLLSHSHGKVCGLTPKPRAKA